MMRTLKSGLTIGMLVAALAMTGGCGENDNSGNGNDNGSGGNPTPRRTSTPVAGRTSTPIATTATPAPVPTSTPGGSTQEVDFDFTATNPMQSFQIHATYPKTNGSFTGSDDKVLCKLTDGSGGILTKKDNDVTGVLTLSVASTENLTFPIKIECPFDATTPITATDIVVTVEEVTQNNVAGNTADLIVAVAVKAP